MAGCCNGRRRIWALLTAICALALLSAAVYLYMSLQPLVATLNSVVALLRYLSSVASSIGASAVSRLPSGILDVMRQVLPYLDFLSMGPAVISMVLLLVSAGLGGCAKEQRSFCCAKLFSLLSEVALVIALAFYLALSAAALMADRPVLTDQWAGFTAVCEEQLPEMQSAARVAQISYTNFIEGGVTVGEIATARAQLDAALLQVSNFEQLCAHLDAIPQQVMGLQGAGLACLVTTVLAFISVNAMCCAAGCCLRPKTSRVAPVEEEVPKGETATIVQPFDYDDDLVAS